MANVVGMDTFNEGIRGLPAAANCACDVYVRKLSLRVEVGCREQELSYGISLQPADR